MKKVFHGFRILVGLACLLAVPVLADSRPSSSVYASQLLMGGEPAFKGVIVSTTTKNNSDTATPFTLTSGHLLLIQCDVATYVLTGATVTAANGVKLEANEKYWLLFSTTSTQVSCLPVSGTSSCKVWDVL